MAVPIDTASSASRQHYIDTGRYLLEGHPEEDTLSADMLRRIARASRRWNDPRVQQRAKRHRERIAKAAAKRAEAEARARSEKAGVPLAAERIHGGRAA